MQKIRFACGKFSHFIAVQSVKNIALIPEISRQKMLWLNANYINNKIF
jgi:hypothetical protein